MVDEPVRIGIIGCDGYARELIQRVWTLPGEGVIAAAVSPDVSTAGAEALRDRGVPVYDRVEDFLSDDGFEAVINVTPIHLHARLTRQCLRAGYPVWMEKPPTATVQELDALVEEAESLGLPVAVNFNSLYGGLIQELKGELVAGRYGAVGRVRGVGAWIRSEDYFTRSDWSGRLRVGADWILDGSMNNPFAHVLCNGLYFAASDHDALASPVRVTAELYHANDIETEDTSSLRVETREGVEVLTHFTLAPETEIPPTTVIETDRAVLTLVDFESLRVHWRDGGVEERSSRRDNRVEMLEHLCRAVRTGEAYRCPLAMCRPFTLAVNAGFDSAGEVLPVPEARITRRPRDGSIAVAVRDLSTHLRTAHDEAALLSELGVPWARSGRPIDTDAYACFPTRFSTVPEPVAES